MKDMKRYEAYIRENLDKSMAELSRYCSQPSVAAQNWGLAECAALTAEMLEARGFSAEVIPTGGAPVVYGERHGRSNKTLLFYNHWNCGRHPHSSRHCGMVSYTLEGSVTIKVTW
jgi:acetylornithine deacetylase/succinyl-diaminopimelate desuccinylase-like protein